MPKKDTFPHPPQTPWKTTTGEPLSCQEKIKVMNDGLDDVRQTILDFFEDGIVMGCDRDQMRDVLDALIKDMHSPYDKNKRPERKE